MTISASVNTRANKTGSGKSPDSSYLANPVKISFATWGNPNKREILKLVGKEISKRKNVDVDVFCFSDKESCSTKVITQFAAGEPFDVFYVDDKTFLTLAQKDWLMDLGELEAERKIKVEDYNNIAYSKGLFGNRLLGLSTGINPTLIYYNAKLFKEAGLKNPEEYYKKGEWNLETFVNLSQAISEKFKSPRKVYGIAIRNDWQTIFSMIHCNGGKVISYLPDGSMVSDRKAQESFGAVKQLIDGNYCIYMGNQPKGVSEEELFKSEQVAMVYEGYEYASLFKDIKDFEWDIVPFPSNGIGCKISPLDITVISAAKNAKEKEAVQDFIAFYTGAQGQQLRLEKGEKTLPTLRYAFFFSSEDVVLPGHSNYYYYSLEEGFTEDNSLNYINNREKILSKFNDYLSGRTSINTVIRKSD